MCGLKRKQFQCLILKLLYSKEAPFKRNEKRIRNDKNSLFESGSSKKSRSRKIYAL